VSVSFDASGTLDVSTDPSDLPESGKGPDIYSGALTRCKNLRINQKGLAKTRDGSAKVNATAIDTDIWWIEEQSGVRYVFAGDKIYRNETSIASGLTEAQWAAIKFSAFNDLTAQIFALNGTDRKRIEGSTVYEWGIEPPTSAPELAIGAGVGLTGEYNAVYTYVRKVGDAVVAESNPSDPATSSVILNNQSLSVNVTQPSDPQVTHIRLYRTFAGQDDYYLDREIEVASEFTYGYVFAWELSDGYLTASEGFAFTITDSAHGTQNCYSWEVNYLTHDADDSSGSGDTVYSQNPWGDDPANQWNGYY
jgi:hypothetical protein